MTVDDQTLMAFADGELASEAAAEIAAAVAADPALAARLERFNAVSAVLAGPMRAAAPPPGHDLMRAARQAVAARAAAPRAWTALAAGVAGLSIGLGVALLPRGGAFLDIGGGVTAQGLLETALDNTASGASVTRAGAAVSPLYTVVAADGRSCRAFRTIAPEAVYEGAACREAGGWRLLALASAPRPASGFVEAESGEPAAVAEAMDALDAGDPLTETAERALMARRWSAAGE